VGASERLHVVLVGRRFSSRLSHMIFRPTKKCFELEVWDQKGGKTAAGEDAEAVPRLVEVPAAELGGWIKQQEWEEQWWDGDEEQALLGLHAAHLRACLRAAGVEAWEFDVYDGGCAALAGLSCHVHAYDFEFLRDADCSSFALVPGKDLAAGVGAWRALSVADRAAAFRAKALAPPKAMRRLRPLGDFSAACRQNPSLPLSLLMGSPMTACAATFGGDTRADAALRDRVVYVCAMSGAWDGNKNLLGCCFNNAVDYAATEACCAPGFFPRGRFVMVPTETCKMGPFTLTREHVASAAAHEDRRALQAVLRDDIGQWTDLKRGETQALFDAVPVLPLRDLATWGWSRRRSCSGRTGSPRARATRTSG
jgi:hypothetical protein